MFEASLAGIDHSHAGFITGFNGLVVVVRSSWLNNGGNSLPNTHVNAVPKREKGVADHDAVPQSALFIFHPGHERCSSQAISQIVQIVEIVLAAVSATETDTNQVYKKQIAQAFCFLLFFLQNYFIAAGFMIR